jgi:hypothetical protein
MVLDGGFPSLVTQLNQSRGAMEPVIINHEHEKWSNYLIVTGRMNSLKTDLQVSKDFLNSQPQSSASHKTSQLGKSSVERSQRNEELEQARTALDVATRLGHGHMRKILEERIERLLRLESR